MGKKFALHKHTYLPGEGGCVLETLDEAQAVPGSTDMLERLASARHGTISHVTQNEGHVLGDSDQEVGLETGRLVRESRPYNGWLRWLLPS